jgi:hypothetical protein
MPKAMRVVGIPNGAVDPERQEVSFALATAERKAFSFVAKIGVAEQIIAGLGRMVHGIREARLEKGEANAQTTAAEDVAQYLVQRDPWADRVLLRLVTPQGVPYTFALPASAAADMGARLNAESANRSTTGRA